MIEGSDDRARADELDLGDEDQEYSHPTPNGTPDHARSTNGLGDDSMAYIEEDLPAVDSPDLTPAKNAPPVDVHTNDAPVSPRPGQPGAPGSVDETVSTPDDTPSLHVGRQSRRFWSSMFADSNRAPYRPRKAAVLWPFETPLAPAPARALRTVRSIFVSSLGSLLHR